MPSILRRIRGLHGFGRKLRLFLTPYPGPFNRFKSRNTEDIVPPAMQKQSIRSVSARKRRKKYAGMVYYRESGVSSRTQDLELLHESFHLIQVAWHDHIRMPINESGILAEIEDSLSDYFPGGSYSTKKWKKTPRAEIHSRIQAMNLGDATEYEVLIDSLAAHFSDPGQLLLACANAPRVSLVRRAMEILNTVPNPPPEKKERVVRRSLSVLANYLLERAERSERGKPPMQFKKGP